MSVNFSLTTPLGDGILSLNRFQGSEAISELFCFNLELSSEDKQIDFSKLIGQKATIKSRISDEIDEYRKINGIIGDFCQSGTDGNQALYTAKLRPWLWLLSFSNDYKVYQNMSVIEIIEAIFAEFGFKSYETKLKKTYSKRDYCTQYGETHYDFVNRLLADEGIFYFFTHTDKDHILLLCDNNTVFSNCPHLQEIEYRADNHEAISNSISSISYSQQVTSNEYSTNDYDFKKANTDISTPKITTSDNDARFSTILEYPGNYTAKSDGEKRAEIRLEALEFNKKSIAGDGNVKSFIPGFKFTLNHHYRDDLNTQFVVKSINHTGNLDRYSNSFSGFSPKTTCRPKQATNKPNIYGSQTAVVTGPAGEEIYTDEHGRIKVQFHWDKYNQKDEKSSIWVRVSQNWAGNGFGIMTIPRVGSEVVISFLNGDPDRPLVTGMVYNSNNHVPYNLPADQTKSTIKSNSSKGGSGFNEIRFEDKKGSEEFFIHAQKNLNSVILNNETRKIEHNRTTSINEGDESFTITKGNRTETLEEGDDTLSLNKGSKSISLDEGNFDITLLEGNMSTILSKGDRMVTVLDGNETHLVEKNRLVTVNGNETLVTTKKKEISVTENEKHENKADFSHDVKGKYTLKITGDLIIDVTGNIEFKSKGNIDIEAKQNLALAAKMKLSSEAMTIEEKASTGWKVDGGALGSIKAAILKLQ